MVVTAYKTEGFGALGTLTDVSRGGISDIADDGSICVDTDLQVNYSNTFDITHCVILHIFSIVGNSFMCSIISLM